jgi:hypothetical protein
MMMTRLTKQRLDAIVDALTARLVGEIETDIPVAAYVAALRWAQQRRKRLRTGAGQSGRKLASPHRRDRERKRRR